MAAAYAGLPAATKDRLTGLKAMHVYQSKHSARKLMGLPDAAKKKVPEAVYHPILYVAFYAFGEVSSAYSEINSGIPASRSHTIVRKVPYTFPEVRAGPIV